MGNSSDGWLVPLLLIGGLLVGGWFIFTTFVIPSIGKGIETRLKNPTTKVKLDKLSNDIQSGRIPKEQGQQQFFNILAGKQ